MKLLLIDRMLRKIIKGINFYFFQIIKVWINERKEYNYFGKLLKRVKRKNLLYNKKIVFNVTRSQKNSINVELFAALLLAINGAKVKILLDDGIMRHWDSGYLEKKQYKKLKKTPLNIFIIAILLI